MLSLIILTLVAGVSYGQEQGKYSDCDTVSTITNKCATQHLAYLKELNQAHYTQMQMPDQMDQASMLLDKVDTICNDIGMHLKEYYQCVFTNITTCLEEKNSTQLMGIPDVKSISEGVVDMCSQREDMNKSCLSMKVGDVVQCVGKTAQGRGVFGQPCTLFLEIVKCTDMLEPCKGREAVRDFTISARPRMCEDPTSPAHLSLPSGLLLLVMLLARVIVFQ